jgi:nicotinate dehydrogenase subunit A
VLTAKALLDTNPKPADSDVRRACESLICRCGSHTRILSAVQRAATLLGNPAVKA